MGERSQSTFQLSLGPIAAVYFWREGAAVAGRTNIHPWLKFLAGEKESPVTQNYTELWENTEPSSALQIMF